jgi:hypothetical protein
MTALNYPYGSTVPRSFIVVIVFLAIIVFGGAAHTVQYDSKERTANPL